MKGRRDFIKKLAVGAVAAPAVIGAVALTVKPAHEALTKEMLDKHIKDITLKSWHEKNVRILVDLNDLPPNLNIEDWMYYYKSTGTAPTPFTKI